MIISKTPFRISFFGGGTDFPQWYRAHGGAVLATTIDKYCYLTCRVLPPFLDYRYRIVYRQIEVCNSVDEIQHPVVRAVLSECGLSDKAIELQHAADLMARSGTGSSSAFMVGLLNCAYALKGAMPTKQLLAKEAIRIEQEVLQESVGSQDQVCAAYGGLNLIEFGQSGEIMVRPVTISKERTHELNSHLMLFYTAVARTSGTITQSYAFEAQRRHLRILRQLVDDGIQILTSDRDICQFGTLLDEAWKAKKSLSTKVSSDEVEEIYSAALEAGAIGGKLMGAGGGGFMLLFVPPDRQAQLREKLNMLINVPFRFEFTGSQLVYFNPEQSYEESERYRLTQNLKPFR